MKELITSYLACAKSRKEVIFIYAWPAFIGISIASRGLPSFLDALKLLLSVIFVGYSVYYYNDIKDMNDDLKNKNLGNPTPASRPLGSGRVSKARMVKFSLFSGVFGLLMASLINFKVFFLQLFYISLGVMYSTEPIRLKRRLMMKQFIVGAGIVLECLSGGLTIGLLSPPVLFLAALGMLIAIGINPLLDLRDYRGDEIAGVKTLPIVWGPEMTVRFALAILIAIGASGIIGYLSLGFNLVMPILATIIVSTCFYIIFPLLKKWNDPVYVNTVLNKRVILLIPTFQLVLLIGVLPL